MEAFFTYLIRSSVWLTGFGLIYLLFLRNERYFVLNRIFLLAGMIASLCFPFIRFHYIVAMPVFEAATVAEIRPPVADVMMEPQQSPDYLFYVYLSGTLYLIFRLLKQTILVARVIRKSRYALFNNTRLVRNDRYPAPFSFFSYVFVNPSISDAETYEIVNHEREHIRQRHWLDLLLFELLCILQWFNPAVWFYGRFIRQNHEYLADESALKRSMEPGKYRAALLNQMFDAEVIRLSNSFNYSLNKKRFIMMKQPITSPARKLRFLSVLPFVAGVFYAFAIPEYRFISEAGGRPNDSLRPSQMAENLFPKVNSDVDVQPGTHVFSQSDNDQKPLVSKKTMKGTVTDTSGNPLENASVVISGTSTGTTTDAEGHFELEMDDSRPLFVSYVGFRTAKVPPDFEQSVTVRLELENIGIDSVIVIGSAVTKPSPEPVKPAGDDNKVFTIVEQMPEFPGGAMALRKSIAWAIKYPRIAAEENAEGTVFVSFVVNRDGYIWNAKVVKSVHPALDHEAIRVIYSLPKWQPGFQHGKPVDVNYTIPIEFVIQ